MESPEPSFSDLRFLSAALSENFDFPINIASTLVLLNYDESKRLLEKYFAVQMEAQKIRTSVENFLRLKGEN